MTSSDRNIRSFADLCTALKVDDLDGFESWLENVHDEPEWLFCDTTIEADGLSVDIYHSSIDRVVFEVPFPCMLDDVWAAAQVMEDAVSRNQDAWLLSELGFGDPDAEDDDTEEIARLFCVDSTRLLAAVGGPWTHVEEGPREDDQGGLIYHWFSRGADGSVWLGISGDNVYIEPVTIDDDGSRIVEEWPAAASANLLYAEAQGYGLTEVDFLDRLRKNIDTAEQKSTTAAKTPRRRRRMGDHDVRMATRNFRVGGVDLDFEVKIDGLILGTLAISEGGLLWRPANHQKRHGIPITWAEFAAWAESETG